MSLQLACQCPIHYNVSQLEANDEDDNDDHPACQLQADDNWQSDQIYILISTKPSSSVPHVSSTTIKTTTTALSSETKSATVLTTSKSTSTSAAATTTTQSLPSHTIVYSADSNGDMKQWTLDSNGTVIRNVTFGTGMFLDGYQQFTVGPSGEVYIGVTSLMVAYPQLDGSIELETIDNTTMYGNDCFLTVAGNSSWVTVYILDSNSYMNAYTRENPNVLWQGPHALVHDTNLMGPGPPIAAVQLPGTSKTAIFLANTASNVIAITGPSTASSSTAV
ncbi:hypothetical protein ANO11243_097570 [Dothideomycetidae sp. 11243]|nr:hypothetical protein ANO11243_097570 [fungal sp. No.11243]